MSLLGESKPIFRALHLNLSRGLLLGIGGTTATSWSMLITGYLVAINALSFSMHAEDKAVSTGFLPFLGRIPGNIL